MRSPRGPRASEIYGTLDRVALSRVLQSFIETKKGKGKRPAHRVSYLEFLSRTASALGVHPIVEDPLSGEVLEFEREDFPSYGPFLASAMQISTLQRTWRQFDRYGAVAPFGQELIATLEEAGVTENEIAAYFTTKYKPADGTEAIDWDDMLLSLPASNSWDDGWWLAFWPTEYMRYILHLIDTALLRGTSKASDALQNLLLPQRQALFAYLDAHGQDDSLEREARGAAEGLAELLPGLYQTDSYDIAFTPNAALDPKFGLTLAPVGDYWVMDLANRSNRVALMHQALRLLFYWKLPERVDVPAWGLRVKEERDRLFIPSLADRESLTAIAAIEDNEIPLVALSPNDLLEAAMSWINDVVGGKQRDSYPNWKPTMALLWR